MNENNGLEIGKVYDLVVKGRNFGKVLYMRERKAKGIIYRGILVRRGGEFIIGIFEGYTLSGQELSISVNRGLKLSDGERKFLDDRLKRAGL